MPAAANASSGTRVSTLPNDSRPRALARRRAGSTVSDEHLAAELGRGHGAGRGRGGRLADAARPAADDDLLGGEQLLERAASAPAGRAGHQEPSSSPRWLGDAVGGPHAVRALEQVGHVEHGSVPAELGPQLLEVPGPGAAQADGELRRPRGSAPPDPRPRRRARPTICSSRRRRSNDSSSPRAEQLGQDPVDDDGGQVDDRLLAEAPGQLDGLAAPASPPARPR